MTAPRPADDQREKPPHLALDDPASIAFGARLIQIALERRRQRLTASEDDGDRDA
jgi:hypothetical protein